MKIRAPAKINLFLEIGAPAEGFHKIVSLVDIINLYDIIEIEEASRTRVIFHPGTGIPAENTVTKSISILKSLFEVKRDVRIEIRKNIPPGSGLAGGSSDAASVLKALVKLWDITVQPDRLMRIGSQIGKDVPLFMAGRRCVMRGFGEQVSTDAGRQPLAYFLAIPPFPVSTAEVYSRFDAMGLKGNLTEAEGKIKLLIDSIEGKSIDGARQIMKNGLEEAYFSLWHRAKEVRDYLRERTGTRIFVSGSGGTLFSVFPDIREAEEKTRLLNVEGWSRYVAESTTAS